jgi:cytochrome b subunit of formate dehydrogenase
LDSYFFQFLRAFLINTRTNTQQILTGSIRVIIKEDYKRKEKKRKEKKRKEKKRKEKKRKEKKRKESRQEKSGC